MIATASKPIRKRRSERARRCTFKNAYTRFFSRVQVGPNLYAGYYAMGLGMDLMGLVVWDADQQEKLALCIEKAKELEKKHAGLVEHLKKKGCIDKEYPFVCSCCSLAGVKSGGAYWDPNTKTVTLCWDILKKSLYGYAGHHELVHASDECQGADFNDCEQTACSEIRASYVALCGPNSPWREKGQSREDCAIKRAINSIQDKFQNAEECVMNVKDQCMPKPGKPLPRWPM